MKAEKLKEKALELADLKKKLEEADNDIKTKDADIVEKVKEIENLKALIKVPHLKIFGLHRYHYFDKGRKRDNRSSKRGTGRKDRGAQVCDEEVG